MNQNLTHIITQLKTKPPNIPKALFKSIFNIAKKYGKKYPFVEIEEEIIAGSKNILQSSIPVWVFDLTAQDWDEFFVELSKIPHRGNYMVWLLAQMKMKLK